MIDGYNSGAWNVGTSFAKLTAFARKLSEEERRGISEHCLKKSWSYLTCDKA